MHIAINNITVEVLPGETIIETARRTGCVIPSLCYEKGANHKSSCMVCAVKNCSNGQIIPSCSTLPTEGMQIETESEEVLMVRTLSLELLLSDHRADCEAPCSMVCPKGLDVERMLGYYDNGQHGMAYSLIADAFMLPEIGCDNCKALCEKACRRGTIDKPVSIRAIIKEVVGLDKEVVDLDGEIVGLDGKMVGVNKEIVGLNKEKDGLYGEIVSLSKGITGLNSGNPIVQEEKLVNQKIDKQLFFSRLGRFTEKEKSILKQTVTTPSTCLHCACAGRKGCNLRHYATAMGIKRPRYDASSALPAMGKVHVKANMWLEPAKCIRCGLCVYNSKNGFTFKDRGFGMQIVIPEENKDNVAESIAGICPTGALFIIDNPIT